MRRFPHWAKLESHVYLADSVQNHCSDARCRALSFGKAAKLVGERPAESNAVKVSPALLQPRIRL